MRKIQEKLELNRLYRIWVYSTNGEARGSNNGKRYRDVGGGSYSLL